MSKVKKRIRRYVNVLMTRAKYRKLVSGSQANTETTSYSLHCKWLREEYKRQDNGQRLSTRCHSDGDEGVKRANKLQHEQNPDVTGERKEKDHQQAFRVLRSETSNVQRLRCLERSNRSFKTQKNDTA